MPVSHSLSFPGATNQSQDPISNVEFQTNIYSQLLKTEPTGLESNRDPEFLKMDSGGLKTSLWTLFRCSMTFADPKRVKMMTKIQNRRNFFLAQKKFLGVRK